MNIEVVELEDMALIPAKDIFKVLRLLRSRRFLIVMVHAYRKYIPFTDDPDERRLKWQIKNELDNGPEIRANYSSNDILCLNCFNAAKEFIQNNNEKRAFFSITIGEDWKQRVTQETSK